MGGGGEVLCNSVPDKLTICRIYEIRTKKGEELRGAGTRTMWRPTDQKVAAMNDKDAASLFSCVAFLLLLLLLLLLVMMMMTVQYFRMVGGIEKLIAVAASD